jgi:hypothetical protein
MLSEVSSMRAHNELKTSLVLFLASAAAACGSVSASTPMRQVRAEGAAPAVPTRPR